MHGWTAEGYVKLYINPDCIRAGNGREEKGKYNPLSGVLLTPSQQSQAEVISTLSKLAMADVTFSLMHMYVPMSSEYGLSQRICWFHIFLWLISFLLPNRSHGMKARIFDSGGPSMRCEVYARVCFRGYSPSVYPAATTVS